MRPDPVADFLTLEMERTRLVYLEPVALLMHQNDECQQQGEIMMANLK